MGGSYGGVASPEAGIVSRLQKTTQNYRFGDVQQPLPLMETGPAPLCGAEPGRLRTPPRKTATFSSRRSISMRRTMHGYGSRMQEDQTDCSPARSLWLRVSRKNRFTRPGLYLGLRTAKSVFCLALVEQFALGFDVMYGVGTPLKRSLWVRSGGVSVFIQLRPALQVQLILLTFGPTRNVLFFSIQRSSRAAGTPHRDAN